MRKRLQELVADLGSAFPSAFSPYWRTLPMRRMKKLLTAALFIFSVIGFVVDLLSLGGQRLGRGFFWPVFLGAMATGLLAARVKRIRLFPYGQNSRRARCPTHEPHFERRFMINQAR
jgi:hypothetical protein